MLIISALLTSLTIAREWKQGMMEQLLSTPVRPIEVMFGLFDMIACLVIAVTVFDVPLKGNVVLLSVTSCIFLFGALSKGIFLEAVGVQALWVEILLLIFYAVFVFVVAARKMRQKVA